MISPHLWSSLIFLLIVAAFDTSCFSGEYVTGETLGDEYFTRLYDLRNEGAKQKRNGDSTTDKTGRAKQSNEGCESMSNDLKPKLTTRDSCESINNQI